MEDAESGSTGECSVLRKQCVPECKRCEMDERLRAIINKSLRSLQHGYQHSACQTDDNSLYSDVSKSQVARVSPVFNHR